MPTNSNKFTDMLKTFFNGETIKLGCIEGQSFRLYKENHDSLTISAETDGNDPAELYATFESDIVYKVEYLCDKCKTECEPLEKMQECPYFEKRDY